MKFIMSAQPERKDRCFTLIELLVVIAIVDAAQKEHWRLLFGEKSAKYLDQFYKLHIDRWVNHYLPNIKQIELRCIPPIDYKALYKAYTPAIAKKMKYYLTQAEKHLIPGARRRFDFFAMPWERIFNEIHAYQKLKVPDYRVKFGTPVVDGDLKDAVWKKAVKMNLKDAFYGENKKGAIYPDVRMLWDKKGIYLGFRSPAPYAVKGKIWSDDNFELFLSPGMRKDKVFQFVLSTSNKLEDFFISFDPPRPADALWECENIRRVVKTNKNNWTAEVFIPFASLDRSPAPIPGDYWHGNLVSNRTDTLTTSLSPTQGNNRNISLYSRLYFAGNCE